MHIFGWAVKRDARSLRVSNLPNSGNLYLKLAASFQHFVYTIYNSVTGLCIWYALYNVCLAHRIASGSGSMAAAWPATAQRTDDIMLYDICYKQFYGTLSFAYRL